MLRISSFILCITFFTLRANAQEVSAPEVNELISAEYNMSVLAAERGILTAFRSYFDENTILFTPSPTKALDYLDNRPKLPDLMTWKPAYANIARSNEWGFTTGQVSWQSVGSTKKYGAYLSLWKRDRKGVWKIAYRAVSEHGKPDTETGTIFLSPENSHYRKSRSKARLKQREDIIASTDQLFATILKADNNTAFKEFLTENARIYLPAYNPIIGLSAITSFLHKKQIVIESTPKQVDRAYSGELAFSSGEAIVRVGSKPIKCNYIRIWELQDGAMWKVTVDMYIKQ